MVRPPLLGKKPDRERRRALNLTPYVYLIFFLRFLAYFHAVSCIIVLSFIQKQKNADL